MQLREWFKWDQAYERGAVWGLIVAYIALAFLGQSDTSLLNDYHNGNVPYGWLWTKLNPWWWTQQPYMLLVSLVMIPVWLVNYKMYKLGKVPKTYLLMNFFNAIFFQSMHVWQQSTVIMFAPLAVVNPLFVLIMVFQKFPLGWSWDFSDKHWDCGIEGECIDFYNSRLDIVRSDFVVHIALFFWMISPIFLWWKRRTGHYPMEKVLKWFARHKKILFILVVAFLLFLTLYAWYKNGDFWTWKYGDSER